jgi:cell wall assembly regulator SMI1
VEDAQRVLGRDQLLTALAPGASPETVSRALKSVGLEPQQQLVELYSWHNGTLDLPGQTYGKIWLIPGYFLAPVEEMASIYSDLLTSGYWSPLWFPFLLDDAGYFYVVDYTKEKYGQVRHIRNDYLDQPIIESLSLADMFATVAAAYRQSVYFLDSDGDLDEDYEKYAVLAAKMNPDVPWWTNPQ